jgi:cyclase
LIREAADRFGSQSIVVSIDIRKRLTGREEVMMLGGTVKTGLSPDEAAVRMMDLGAGELMIHSIDRDGQMRGYDTALLRRISNKVTVPVVACGGAGNPGHMKEAVREGGAHAVAAGSVFVFHGPRKAVLINYPEKNELNSLFSET